MQFSDEEILSARAQFNWVSVRVQKEMTEPEKNTCVTEREWQVGPQLLNVVQLREWIAIMTDHYFDEL